MWAHVGGFLGGVAIALPMKYIFLEKKLGPNKTPRHVPREVRTPSRSRDRTRAFEQPFPDHEPVPRMIATLSVRGR